MGAVQCDRLLVYDSTILPTVCLSIYQSVCLWRCVLWRSRLV